MEAVREELPEKHAGEEAEEHRATGDGDPAQTSSIHAGMEDRKEVHTEERPEDHKDDVADPDVHHAASDKQWRLNAAPVVVNSWAVKLPVLSYVSLLSFNRSDVHSCIGSELCVTVCIC